MEKLPNEIIYNIIEIQSYQDMITTILSLCSVDDYVMNLVNRRFQEHNDNIQRDTQLDTMYSLINLNYEIFFEKSGYGTIGFHDDKIEEVFVVEDQSQPWEQGIKSSQLVKIFGRNNVTIDLDDYVEEGTIIVSIRRNTLPLDLLKSCIRVILKKGYIIVSL